MAWVISLRLAVEPLAARAFDVAGFVVARVVATTIAVSYQMAHPNLEESAVDHRRPEGGSRRLWL